MRIAVGVLLLIIGLVCIWGMGFGRNVLFRPPSGSSALTPRQQHIRDGGLLLGALLGCVGFVLLLNPTIT
jgi:uncharacterized membrane protein HdeD (DUF308 family)